MDWIVAILLYLFTRLDALQGLFVALGFSAAVGVLFATMLLSIIGEEFKAFKKLISVFAVIVIASAFLAVAIPTQKDMALIVGGAIGYEQASRLVSDERFQRLSDNSLKSLEMWVEEQTKEKQND